MFEIFDKYGLKVVSTIRTADGGTIRAHVVKVQPRGLTQPQPRGLIQPPGLYVAKIFDSQDQEAKNRFIKDIQNIRAIRRNLSPKYKNWLVNIRRFSTKGNHPFYIYKYVEGEVLGRFVQDFGIKWGYFDHKNFYRFIEYIEKVASMPLMESHVEKMDTWGARTARKEIQFYFENVPDFLPNGLYDQVKTFMDRQSRVGLAFKHKEFSHRDLYPENILIAERKSEKITFLDWEYFSKVPIGFNAAFLYLLFWREDYWKAKIFSSYYRKYSQNEKRLLEAFKTSFRYCLVILAVRFLYQLEAYGDKNSPDYQVARRWFLTDLQNSLGGTIVKPQSIKFYLSKHDVQKVADIYELGKVSAFEIFYASKGNTVAKVKADDRYYIFRFYSQSRSKRLIKRELAIFRKLSENRLKTYTVYEPGIIEVNLYGKKRKVAVLSFLNGRKISQKWANKKAAYGAGEMLRKIHNCNVVHNDYSKENVLFVKSKVSGVIDFEWGRVTRSRSAKHSDLAKAIALWLIDIRSKSIEDAQFVSAFLEGYFGYMPAGDKLRSVLETVIDKIEQEREIFLTTIDHAPQKETGRHGIVGLGKRFDSAIQVIRTFK